MNHLSKLATALLLAFSLQTAVHALPLVVGNLNFLGVAQVNDSDLMAATQVKSLTAFAGTSDGSFSAIAFATPIVFAISPSAPWSFNSGAVANFWCVGGFTFDLISSSVVTQDANFLNIVGSGTVKNSGYEDTLGTWSFTIPGRSANGSFSFAAASSSVPDGGMTATLFGVSLIGMSVIARRRRPV